MKQDEFVPMPSGVEIVLICGNQRCFGLRNGTAVYLDMAAPQLGECLITCNNVTQKIVLTGRPANVGGYIKYSFVVKG